MLRNLFAGKLFYFVLKEMLAYLLCSKDVVKHANFNPPYLDMTILGFQFPIQILMANINNCYRCSSAFVLRIAQGVLSQMAQR